MWLLNNISICAVNGNVVVNKEEWSESQMQSSEKVEKLVQLLRRLRGEVERRFRARIEGVFGSWVRGEETEESDIDVLVEFLDGATLFEFVGLSQFLQGKLMGRDVDVVPRDALREELRERILSEVVWL